MPSNLSHSYDLILEMLSTPVMPRALHATLVEIVVLHASHDQIQVLLALLLDPVLLSRGLGHTTALNSCSTLVSLHEKACGSGRENTYYATDPSCQR